MKYETLQQARRLVESYSQEDRDLLLPFLPALPEQKTISEIIEDVYEAYMCAEDEPNSNRLDEIHFQLTNWVKITPARETAFFVEDYEQLPENSVVLGRGVPWFKRDILWYGAFGESRSSKEMAGDPREVIRKGTKNV